MSNSVFSPLPHSMHLQSVQDLRGIQAGTFDSLLISNGLRVAATPCISTPVGRVWPDGTFGLGVARLSAPEIDVHIEVPDFDGNHARWLKAASRVGSSNASNSHSPLKTRAPRGSKGISSYGRKIVRNACYLLEERYKKEHLSFGTLTLPALSDEDKVSAVDNWSDIVRVLFQRLKRHLRAKGLPGNAVWVTESQSERAGRERWLAPHLHFVFVGRKPKSEWALHYEDLRRFWRESVERYTSGHYDWSATENIQAIKKSASQYLSKYLSKGTPPCLLEMDGPIGKPTVSAWYGVSRPLLRAIRKLTLSGSAMAFLLQQIIHDWHEYGEMTCLKWIRKIYDSGGSSGKVLGTCGQLSRLGNQQIRSELETYLGVARQIHPLGGLTGK